MQVGGLCVALAPFTARDSYVFVRQVGLTLEDTANAAINIIVYILKHVFTYTDCGIINRCCIHCWLFDQLFFITLFYCV